MLAAAGGLSALRCSPKDVTHAVLTSSDAGDYSGSDAGPAPSPRGVDAGLGVLVLDLADTPCATSGATSVQLLNADAGAPWFRSLHAVGTRRAADGIGGEGFVTFEADGTRLVSAIGTTGMQDNLVASTGSGILLAGSVEPEAVVFRAYDALGMPQGTITTLAGEVSDGLGVCATATSALVAWGGPTALRGRGIVAATPAGNFAFDLALTNRTHGLTLSIVDDDHDRFAFVFSGDDSGTANQTVFGRATTMGRVGDPVAIFTGDRPRRIVQLAKLKAGYAFVLSAGGSTPVGTLVILDVFGRVVVARRLLGTTEALGLARQGDELGVTAIRTILDADAGTVRHAPAFRPFDATGEPLGPWVCLADPGVAPDVGAAIMADGVGYAVVYRGNDGATKLGRFDHLGTGVP